jgi:hypothetical protein
MGTVDSTTASALGLTITLFLGALLFVLPRRYAPIPMLIIGAYMTYGEIINIAGFHFMMMRVMILIGWLRLLIRGEFKILKLNKLDVVFLCWLAAHFLISVLREQTADALVYQLGFAYNALGLYFLFRCLIQDTDDYDVILKSLAIIAIPLALIFVMEMTTGRNIFAAFGGVPEYSEIREGRLRCQGPFRHPILAGTFGATLFPLFVSLYIKKGDKLLAMFALIASLVIVAASASSGPLLALIGAVIALAMWPVRRSMRQIRWGILITIIALHFYMKAPVWYLISHISDIAGGSGWHRSELINQAIIHFDSWWLMGTSDTAYWLPYNLSLGSGEATDITNQFISEGVNGGIVTLSLFILLIVMSYKYIGHELNIAKSKPKHMEIVVWCLGVSLFAHLLSFISVTYFDQMMIYWYLLLSIIAVMNMPTKRKAV